MNVNLPFDKDELEEQFFDAVIVNDFEKVKQLLDDGVDINATNYSLTALMKACACGYTKLVKLLLDRGADVTIKNSEGSTALMMAKETENEETINLLFHYEQNQEIFDAIKDNNIPEVKRLLAKGEDVNARDAFARTTLMYACLWENVETVRLLLERGASVELKDKDNATVLMYAIKSQNIEIAKILLDHGADIHAEGDAALIYAVSKAYTKMFLFLLKHKADVKAKDKQGRTALMIACVKGNIELVKLLLKHGANVNEVSLNNWTALEYACLYGNYTIIKLLIDRGANINAKNLDGSTPLIITCRSNNSTAVIAKLLLKKGADVNAQDACDGQTALMIAAERDDHRTVEVLLKHGANVNLKDKEGNTALMFAVKKNWHWGGKTIKLLLDHGAKNETLVTSSPLSVGDS